MGTPKPLLDFDGRPLLRWMLDRLAPVFAEALVSANDDAIAAAAPPGTRTLRDLHLGAGPLAGIEAGLAAAAHERVFVVACDMPLITADLARAIVEALGGHQAAVPRFAGRAEPVAAAYARSAAVPAVAAALGRGERRAAAVLEELDVAWLDGLDPRAFRSINTPSDYRALLGAIG